MSQGNTTPTLSPEKLSELKTLFQEQLDSGLHPGASMAVYHRGKLVLDIYGGIADIPTATPVNSDTMFVTFSCTKAISAFAWHILWERGQLELGHFLQEYWPEFGANGKETINFRHILTHTAGFPQTPATLNYTNVLDWDKVTKAMEEAKPIYKPGETIAYHSWNMGFVIGEIVRRIDGRVISRFLQDEVFDPIGINDFHIGLPPEKEARVATVYGMEGFSDSKKLEFFNTSKAHQAIIPASNGISTARDLARFYGMLSMGGSLDGVDIMRPGAIKGAAVQQLEGLDKAADYPRWVKLGLGWAIDDPSMGSPSGEGRFDHSVGHGGLGSCVGWMDINHKLGVAILTNGVREPESNAKRLGALSDAIKACLS